MNDSVRVQHQVQFTPDTVRIDGKPQILLSASLFYFRIPRAEWRQRMDQVKSCGYNSIDVYFPWNYHERTRDAWDFADQRDVHAFLEEAHQAGLWVIARPGPYICSEWDGGSLPAYLFADGVRVREADPHFLAHVARWYAQILPILKAHEVTSGGCVLMVQLDNELDFYGCEDPAAYMAALRDLTRAADITVPLIACAGQGGIYEASGLVDDVVPTCNFYPDDYDAALEEKVHIYRQMLAERGHPLLVTETNRSHYLLRRLLGCGVKLLGPYLQVSGTDYGFTQSINNWGKPLAFMTTDYDFGGMISPEGTLRKEAYEGRLLGRLLHTYGDRLAEAITVELPSTLKIHAPGHEIAVPQTLALAGGGYLVTVTNLRHEAQALIGEISRPEVASSACSDCVDGATQTAHSAQAEVAAATATVSLQAPLAVPAATSLMLPYDVPLAGWGVDGRLVFATAECFAAEQQSERVILAFHTDGPAEIVLALPGVTAISADGAEIRHTGEQVVLALGQTPAAKPQGQAQIALGDCTLQIVWMPRHEALSLDLVSFGPAGEPLLDASGSPADASRSTEAAEDHAAVELATLAWTRADLDGADEGDALHGGAWQAQAGTRPQPLERYGAGRGFGWYRAKVAPKHEQPIIGLLLRGASDIVSLRCDKQYLGTFTPGGGSRYVPLAQPILAQEPIEAEVKAEIWGHSNFDDIRLPALRLSSLKGLNGLQMVSRRIALSGNWQFAKGWNKPQPSDAVKTLISLGSWMSPDHPARETYVYRMQTSPYADAWTLAFEGGTAHVDVEINGTRLAKRPTVFDRHVDITEWVTAGEEVEITLYVERAFGLSLGQMVVYEGQEATAWEWAIADEGELHASATRAASRAVGVQETQHVQAGSESWLYTVLAPTGQEQGWRVRFRGTGLKATLFLDERLIGRVWLPGGEERPVMTGGQDDSFYVPASWCEDEGRQVAILLEAVVAGEAGVLDSVSWEVIGR